MADEYWSERYGDLNSIASATRGRCHLCQEPADLALYGRTGMFGADTVTVDHLDPQVLGGGDEPENLRIAHGNCNSARGIQDPELARLVLADTAAQPLTAAAFNVLSVGGSAAVATAAGYALAGRDQEGRPQFNWRAAAAFGVLTFAFTRVIY